MLNRVVKTQRTVLEQVNRTLSVTIDKSTLTYKREGVLFLPAGTPIGADDGAGNKIDLLLNRSQKVTVKNDKDAFGFLSHDVWFDQDEDEVATICYDGIAYIDEIEDALSEIAGSTTTLAAAAKTAVPDISYKKVA